MPGAVTRLEQHGDSLNDVPNELLVVDLLRDRVLINRMRKVRRRVISRPKYHSGMDT